MSDIEYSVIPSDVIKSFDCIFNYHMGLLLREHILSFNCSLNSEHILSFKSYPFYEVVSSTLKHTLPFKSWFTDANTNILRMPVQLLLRAQWLSDRVLDSRFRGCWFEPNQRHCVVSLSKTLYALLSTGSIQKDPS